MFLLEMLERYSDDGLRVIDKWCPRTTVAMKENVVDTSYLGSMTRLGLGICNDPVTNNQILDYSLPDSLTCQFLVQQSSLRAACNHHADRLDLTTIPSGSIHTSMGYT